MLLTGACARAEAPDGGEDIVGGLSPRERFWRVVVMVDKGADGCSQGFN
jgi:hypothetical protein